MLATYSIIQDLIKCDIKKVTLRNERLLGVKRIPTSILKVPFWQWNVNVEFSCSFIWTVLLCLYKLVQKVSGGLPFTHTWTLMTFHSQSVGFNMELAHLLLPQVMREGFPQDLRVCLWEFVSSSPSVSPDTDFGWCGLALLMNPIGVLSSGVQDSVEAHQVPLHQTLLYMCLWTLWGHFGSRRGLSQTVPSKEHDRVSRDAQFLSLEHQNGPFDCRAEAWIITLHHYSQGFSLPLVI